MIAYLDNSFLNRPFDDPSIALNRLEAEVLSFTIEEIRKGKIALVNSSVIQYENSINPFAERRSFIEELLKLAHLYQNRTLKIEQEAKKIMKELKISPIDALHLASATLSKVDFFITCDYNVIRKFKGKLKVISPIEFLKHYEKSRSN